MSALSADPPPVRPTAPDASDCCGGGCVSCVFDLYQVELEKYEAAVAAWRSRQSEERGDE